MKNEHLLPVNITDLVDKYKKSKDKNEKLNYFFRLEAIRNYCSDAIKQPVIFNNNEIKRRK